MKLKYMSINKDDESCSDFWTFDNKHEYCVTHTSISDKNLIVE